MVHVNRLILIAGPSGSGKSTLIRRLQEGKISWLSEKLELSDPSLWMCINSAQIAYKAPELHVDRMIVHFDLIRKEVDALAYESDKRLAILATSNEITFVTLWTDPETLRERIQERKSRKSQRFKAEADTYQYNLINSPSHKLYKLLKVYEKPSYLQSVYNKWGSFCHKYDAKAHLVIDSTDEKYKKQT